MRGLNPRQVEAFRAVVLTGGVGMAAKLINVTQPAVSRMIRDLQQQLGLRWVQAPGPPWRRRKTWWWWARPWRACAAPCWRWMA